MADSLPALREALKDRYRIERELGRGGMAIVYLAHDLKHDRPVAIKVLRPEIALALGPERFLREIGFSARLNHPHIVPLHDSGTAGANLFYVMPFIAGESLRERLDRDGRLQPGEALRIAREVAAALGHAHASGVIHRDIKPGNILLSEGFALVADFGIARAVTAAADPEMSSTGVAIGTPLYMSPEQCQGDDLDGRSDLYSLGCVLHEMLAGAPPFTGPNPAVVFGRHRTQPPPPVRLGSRRLAVAINGILARALAKAPDQRYSTAEEFGNAIAELTPGEERHRIWWGAGAVVVAAVAFFLVWQPRPPPPEAPPLPRLGVTRIVGGSVSLGDSVGGLVSRLLSEWHDLEVVGLDVAANAPDLDQRARRAKVDRVVEGRLQRTGEVVTLELTLRDLSSQRPSTRGSTRLLSDQTAADSIRAVVATVLFGGRLIGEAGTGIIGSRSIRAVEGYLDGRAAVGGWDLVRADSAFAGALMTDSNFAEASLGLALVRRWQGAPPRTWRLQAQRAAGAESRLGQRDGELAIWLADLAGGTAPSCDRLGQLASRWPNDFTTWYSLANCLAFDDLVLPDRTSRSGRQFRSSYHQAQLAWRRAFDLNPTILRSHNGRPALWLLWTAANRVRSGASADGEGFAAFPSWNADTIAMVPFPDRDFSAGRSRVASPTTREAIRQQRQLFFDLATQWRSTAPVNPDALEAVANALWLLGNRTAVDSMRAVRALASENEWTRIALSEALMRLVDAAPGFESVGVARSLLDSLLSPSVARDVADNWDLATAAALTGRAHEAVALMRKPSARVAWSLPPGLASDAFALLGYAAMGGPAESLDVLEVGVARGIDVGAGREQSTPLRLEWLGRPAVLAHFVRPFTSLAGLVGQGDYLVDAYVAYQTGRPDSARAILSRARADRSWMDPTDLNPEVLFSEASLSAALGDSVAAIAILDPMLAALPDMNLGLLRNPVGAALLVRAMALRAVLGPLSRGSWIAAVSVLWSDANPLQSRLISRTIARSSQP